MSMHVHPMVICTKVEERFNKRELVECATQMRVESKKIEIESLYEPRYLLNKYQRELCICV